MRIALVSQEYPPETAKGGIGTQTFLKAHGLAARGHEIHVISRSPNGGREERMDGRVHVVRIPGFETRMSIQTEVADWMSYSAEVAVALDALHTQTPLDIIDFPEWAAEGYFHLLNRTSWHRIPTVVHLHGPLVMFAHTLSWPEVGSEFYRTGSVMESTCLRLADAVISSSRCSADWCAQHYGLQRERIAIWHSGIDTALFSPQPVDKAMRPTIVFAGKLAKNKGVHLLVDAACDLTRQFSDLHLRLLGRGEPKIVDDLQARVRAAGSADLLDLPGFTRREDLPEQFSRAHVFAAPSEYEGGPGFVYLEAMACGLPVIACEGSGASEVVSSGHNGLLVSRGSREALTAALRELLTDPTKRQRMAKSARAFVVAEADTRSCMQQLETIYTRVASGAPEGDPAPVSAA